MLVPLSDGNLLQMEALPGHQLPILPPLKPILAAQTTLYRAVIQNGVCPTVYSANAVVSVIPPQTPTVTASPTQICVGQSATLTSTDGLGTRSNSVDGSFSSANPTGWCVDKQCTGGFMPANGDNQQTGPWRETNPQNFVGINYTSPQPKFAIANGNVTSVLETPVFSLSRPKPCLSGFSSILFIKCRIQC